MRRVRELDGLRCLAILAVLGVHYRPPFRPRFDLLSLGWVGVDLFFVLSGFLITTNLVSLRGTEHPYRVFYWRRMLRIFPAYYLVLFVLLGVHPQRTLHLGASFFVPPMLFLTAVMDTAPMQQLLHVLHGGALNGVRAPIDNHLFDDITASVAAFWSLSVEELFYLVWAPVVLRCTRVQVVAISLLCVGVCPILRVLGHTPDAAEYWNFFFRFDTLMMGSLLALVMIAYKRGRMGRLSLVRGLHASAIVSFTLLMWLLKHDGFLERVEPRSTLSFAGAGYSLVAVFFAAIVGLCVVHSESEQRWTTVLRSRPFRFVGTISYTMYLIHVPVWIAIYQISVRMHGQQYRPGLWGSAIAASVTISIAALSWRFLEEPVLRFKGVVFSGRKSDKDTEVAAGAS